MKTTKLGLAWVLGMVCGVSLAAGGGAPSTAPVTVHIEAQPMETALNEFASQTGLQLLFHIEGTITPGMKADRVVGTLPVEEALTKLLDGSGLKYEFINARTVAIRAAEEKTVAGENDYNANTGLRLAQVGQTDTGIGEQAPPKAEVEKEEGVQLEEVVVTGTHIRGTSPITPQISFTRNDIEKTGFTTIEDVMESLPQNFAEVSPGGRFAVEGGSSLATSNNDRAYSVDLRGLGAQSTLVLVNGRRWAGSVDGRVFDISTIPLSVVERMDVVTGAHSAIYGADAVGGVVNLVTRRDFDGFETEAAYGGAQDGGERLRIGQLAGMRSTDGGFVLGYEYARDWTLELADAGLLSLQPSPGRQDVTQLAFQAQADTWRHSGFLAGHYKLSDRLEVFADGLYTHKRFEDEDRSLWPGATNASFTRNRHPGDYFGATGGARIALGRDWALEANLGSSTSDMTSNTLTLNDFGPPSFPVATAQRKHDRSTVSSVAAVADGSLPALYGVEPRLAIGLEARQEDFHSALATDGIAETPNDGDRDIHSAFAELELPIVNHGSFTGLRRLELSIAGRYDDYSDFGDTFNPQFGVLWELAAGLRVRGGYSRAFRAPGLVELADSSFAFVVDVTDPQSPSGATPALIWGGDNPDLGPEKATSWNIGLDFEPTYLPGANLSISYFNVEYTDRIELPAVGFDEQLLALVNEGRFPQLIDRNPQETELAQIIERTSSSLGFFNLTGLAFGDCQPGASCNPNANELLVALPTVAVFDSRTKNIAKDEVSGLDFLLKGSSTAAHGTFEYGLNATYTLDHKRFVTETSPPFQLLNEAGKPVDLRLRANLGWSSGSYGVYGYLNYLDGYDNPFVTPAEHIGSWMTTDVTLRFDGRALGRGAFLQGARVTLAVENLFDQRPPRFNSTISGFLYDATNANPFGRYVSLHVAQTW